MPGCAHCAAAASLHAGRQRLRGASLHHVTKTQTQFHQTQRRRAGRPRLDHAATRIARRIRSARGIVAADRHASTEAARAAGDSRRRPPTELRPRPDRRPPSSRSRSRRRRTRSARPTPARCMIMTISANYFSRMTIISANYWSRLNDHTRRAAQCRNRMPPRHACVP